MGDVRVGYTRIGIVKGISYQLDGVAFSGTHLGKAYTFPGLQKHRGVNYSPKRDDKRIQKLMEQAVENPTPAVPPKQDDKRIRKLMEQTVENTTPVTQTNSLPTREPTNWEQIRLKLSQQYNLPNSLLTELYEKGWLYASLAGQAIFVERTLDDLPTLAKQLVVCQVNFARLNSDINAAFFGEHLWFGNPNRHWLFADYVVSPKRQSQKLMFLH